MPAEPQKLPIHGFVLAGGKSSRMGQDKATLHLHGHTLIEIALTKLREFCTEVSISGNRDDLQTLAPIIHETRQDSGPGAGFEACLQACHQPWSLFIPVDVPLVTAALLQAWALYTIKEDNRLLGSTLETSRGKEPAFFIANAKQCEPVVSKALAEGQRSLDAIYSAIREVQGASFLPVLDVSILVPGTSPEQIRRWFSNVNTPTDLSAVVRISGT